MDKLPTPTPLKILLLLNRVPFPLNDGGAIGTYHFVKGYAEAGCEVHVLAMNTSKHFVEVEKTGETFSRYCVLETVKIDNRIRLFPLIRNLFKTTSFVVERFISEEYRTKLAEILQSQKFDVVHIDGVPPALYINTVRKYSNAFISIRAHNVEHIIWQRASESERFFLKKRYLKLQTERLKNFEKKIFAEVDAVLSISREDDELIHELVPNVKTILVPAGLDFLQNKTEIVPENNSLFFIGAMDWLPNIQGVDWFLEKVWARTRDAFPEMKFYLAGKKMSHHFTKLNLPNVEVVGEVTSASDFMREKDIMVVPLLSGSGLRIKILEGMAASKTIIATSIAAEGIACTDGENILLANSPEEFVAQIRKCKNDVSYKKQIGENAFRFVKENYENKSILKHLVNEYKKRI